MERNNASDYDIFMSIIDEVASDVRNDFIKEGMNEATLRAFKNLWKDKLIESKVVDSDRINTFTEKPRQRVSSVAAPDQTSLDFLLNFRIPRPQNASKLATIAGLGQKNSPSESSAFGNLQNVRLAPPNPHMTRRIRQLDGPSDVEFMDDDDDDDDDEFDEQIASFLRKDKDGDNNNNNYGLVEHDDDDDEDETHDLDGIDAPTLDDYEEIFDCDNVIFCQFAKVNKTGRNFKLDLKAGVFSLKGKEHVFGVARGEAHM